MKKVLTKALLKKLGGLAICLSLAATVQAQEVLTLEQSLNLARQNNVALRQAKYNHTKADINVNRSKFSYLPTLSANADVNKINGQTFDNITGQVKNGTTTTSFPYLAGQVVLFDGFTKLFELKRSRQLAEASSYAAQQAEIDLETNITNYYLQALLDNENITIVQERIKLLEGQLDKMEKLERAGVRAQDEVYQIKAQIATEKLNLITFQNNYRRARLQLTQEMNVEGNPEYVLQTPTTPLDLNMSLPTEQEVMARTLGYSPMIKSSAASLEAAKSNLKVVRSNFSPTLSLEGVLSSNYTSNALNDPGNGDFSTIPYFEQLDLNQRKIVGLRLSLPLFNGLSRQFDAQAARIDLRNAELDLVARQNQLRQTVQQVYQDVLAAQEKYNTVMANLEYTEKAFESAKKRYELGTIDFFAYMESLNNKNRVQTELLQSKCEFYFKQRILELFQG
ncbi:outer membrane protein [Pontibacter aydingkolensis]|uniref:TolC family protein n=1 Tax=Pontibacter aydingkolensis TaxID=1911536 RepID=A0ABS7CZP2_9BACT|nr:TolC family protein [Pontibacter aydingkolensis]MBW7469334.1 TolC family protein [Pontibacter aydingkolensis]